MRSPSQDRHPWFLTGYFFGIDNVGFGAADDIDFAAASRKSRLRELIPKLQTFIARM